MIGITKGFVGATAAGVLAISCTVASATTGAHPATKSTTRALHHPYRSTAVDLEVGDAGGAGIWCFSPARATGDDCLQATAGPRERSVRIEMRDVSGLPVAGYLVSQGKFFCGSTLLPVRPGQDITVEAAAGVALAACAEPTRGTIVAVFTRGS